MMDQPGAPERSGFQIFNEPLHIHRLLKLSKSWLRRVMACGSWVRGIDNITLSPITHYLLPITSALDKQGYMSEAFHIHESLICELQFGYDRQGQK